MSGNFSIPPQRGRAPKPDAVSRQSRDLGATPTDHTPKQRHETREEPALLASSPGPGGRRNMENGPLPTPDEIRSRIPPEGMPSKEFLTFYKTPTDPERRQEWAALIRRLIRSKDGRVYLRDVTPPPPPPAEEAAIKSENDRLRANDSRLRAEARKTDAQIDAFQHRIQYLLQHNSHLIGMINGLGFSYHSDEVPDPLMWHGFLPGPDRPMIEQGSGSHTGGTFRGGSLRSLIQGPDLTGGFVPGLIRNANTQDGADGGSSGQQPNLTRKELLDLLDGGETDSESGDDAKAAAGGAEKGDEK